MPVYVYECERCHSRVEKLRPLERRRDPVPCGACGAQTYPVVTRPARFQRGPGWRARMEGARMPGEV